MVAFTTLLILYLLVSTVGAFDDNFQYQNDTSEFAAKWTKGGYDCGGVCDTNNKGYISEVLSNYPSGYAYSKAYHMQACGCSFCNGEAWIKSVKFDDTTNYVSFNLLEYSIGIGGPNVYIYLYNDTDVEISGFDASVHNHTEGFWELVRNPENDNLYFYINGINAVSGGGAADTCAEEFSYFKIRVYCPCSHSSCLRWMDLYIDDVSGTDYPSGGYVSGLGSYQYTHVLTEDDPTEIDYSWTMRHYPHSTFDSYTYKVKITDYDGIIVSSETLTGDDRDSGIRKYDRSTLFGLDYDWYYFITTRDDIEYTGEYLKFLGPLSEGCGIAFDADPYYKGETANISYVINSPDYVLYDYYVRVYFGGTSPRTLVESWEITSGDSGHVEWDTTGVDEGVYLAKLALIDGEEESPLAFDSSAVASGIKISGYTHNATSGVVLGDVSVNFSQGSTWYNTTSNSTTGYYILKGFNTNIQININASKVSYNHTDFSFTPPVEVFYDVDLYLLPTSTDKDLRGLIVSYPLHQAIDGSDVSLGNATWNDTTTSVACGYYYFDDIANGAYNISATMSGYVDSGIIDVTVTSPARKDITLHPSITLKVQAKDTASGTFLNTFKVALNDGALQDAVGGFVTFDNLDWDYYQLRCVADEYYVSYDYVFLVENKTKTINMVKEPGEGGMGVQYVAKHEVQFVVQDKYGNTIDDVTVTATVLESSGPIGWFSSIFGYSNETNIATTTLQGITDSMGSITFHMAETLKYQITFKNIAKDVDETLTIYPKENYYLVKTGVWVDWFGWFSGDEKVDIGEKINWNFTTNEIDDNDAWINVTYNATLLTGTNSVYFWINNSNNTINLHNETWNDNDYCTYNHTLTNYSGNAYYIGFEANHSTKGTIRVVKVLYFKEDRMISIDGWKDGYYQWLSIALLIFIAALFSGVTIKTGALVVPMAALSLWYIGWFECPMVLLMTVMTLGVVYFITSKGSETKLGG